VGLVERLDGGEAGGTALVEGRLRLASGHGLALLEVWFGIVAGGAWRASDPSADRFIEPLAFAQTICGRGDGLAKRRAAFMSAAHAEDASGPEEVDAPPLWEGLGDAHLPISTTSEGAQAYFDQGLRLVYGFNHSEALRAFRYAQVLDPSCAMCAWGEALALGPNINMAMPEDAVAPAYAAAIRAQDLSDGASEKERALIEALGRRYADAPPADRSELDIAYADAMRDVAAQYADDDTIAVLAAEAMMDTQPWVYWETDGRTPIGYTAEVVDLIEGVLERTPEHAGAIHLYIHITEASADPFRAEPYADMLAAQAPNAGHLVHMPSHVYYRIGRFIDSLEANVDAVIADEGFIDAAPASAMYQYGYYTHNIHFVLTSAQMAGDADTVLEMAEKLDQELPMEMAAVAPVIQPIKAAPYFAWAQFGAPEDVLALPDPGDAFPLLQGVWRYARGEALVKQGDLEGARTEADAIEEIADFADFTALTEGGVPAADILAIARHVVLGRAANAEGDHEQAVLQFEFAVDVQDRLPYMEPPYWYYPVRQSLGGALLLNGEPRRAEHVFFESLVKTPNNGWALYGLSEAYADQGARRAARHAKGLFKEAWAGNAKALDAERL
ncbi:MAG: hypothetical protein AAGL49_01560, partial [Pseudomonadota bacterium]